MRMNSLKSLVRESIWVEDEEDQWKDVRQMMWYAPATGKLFVASDDGNIRCGDAKQGILTGSWTQSMDKDETSIEMDDEEEGDGIQVLEPVPELELTVQYFVVNRSGTTAVVAGPSMKDPEITQLVMIEVGARGGVSGQEVPTMEIDASLFSRHAGLHVVDMAWHPDSERHVVVLTSDSTLRVYDVKNPSLAEQTFELRWSGRFRGLSPHEDDVSWNEPVPISFCMGQGNDWNRICVYLLMSNGDVRTICPVAPFGVKYPSAWIRGLLDTSETKENSIDNVEARGHKDDVDYSMIWLHKAFHLDVLDVDAKSLVTSIPHVMDSHVPLLSAPIDVISNDTLLRNQEDRKIDGEYPAGNFLVWQAGPHVTAVVTASASATIRAGVITTPPQPLWISNAPQCVFRGEDIVAVRSQCSPSLDLNGQESWRATCVLIDEIQLPVGSRTNSEVHLDEELENVRVNPIRIMGDTSSTSTVVICQQQCIHSITLPWLSVLDEYRYQEEIYELPDVLPFPYINETVRMIRNEDAPMVAHAVIGDRLSGSAVLCLQSNGKHILKRIKTGTSSINMTEDEDVSGEILEYGRKKVADHVKEMYSMITAGPPAVQLHKFNSSKPVDSPENYRAFVENIKELEKSHIDFCHKARNITEERLKYLGQQVKEQTAMLEALEALVAKAEARQKSIDSSRSKATIMSKNIKERVKLLAELHWAIPRPASQEEIEFRVHELPLLESNAISLAKEVASLRSQAAHMRSTFQRRPQTVLPSVDAMPPHQIRQMREVLTEHDETIRGASQKLKVIERWIDQSL